MEQDISNNTLELARAIFRVKIDGIEEGIITN